MVLSNCEFHYGFTITLSPLGRPGVGQGHPGSGDRVNTKMSPAWRREGDIGTAPLRTRLIRGDCASGKKKLFIITFIGSSADLWPAHCHSSLLIRINGLSSLLDILVLNPMI